MMISNGFITCWTKQKKSKSSEEEEAANTEGKITRRLIKHNDARRIVIFLMKQLFILRDDCDIKDLKLQD